MSCKRTGLALLVLLSLLFTALYYAQKKLDEYFSQPRIDKTMLFTVNSGSNYSKLGNHLKTQGLVSDLLLWKVIGKLHPQLTDIKSGTYQFNEGATIEDILAIVNRGVEYQFKVTFVEGSTFKEWVAILNNAEMLNPIEKNEQQILAMLGSPYSKLEGLLFPETYHYTASMSAYNIIETAYQKQLSVLDKLWAAKRGPKFTIENTL
ncbi:endolytic transglycosylase MltG [Psychromonas sp. MME1]|uniref:endolytic transglycosylase MltG n=1 Tax=Psychromonas sp. MME1 TaxID=3231032 RepID=UPI0034E26EB6